MAARHGDHDVAGIQLARFDQPTVFGVDIHAATSALNNQNFCRADQMPLYRQMHVTRDLLTGPIHHVPELKGNVIGCQIAGLIGRIATRHDIRQHNAVG
jgi:hypothetical protein